MKFEEFERELETLNRSRGSGAGGALGHLQRGLQSAAGSRGDHQEAWAWTRLRSHLRLQGRPGRWSLESFVWQALIPAGTLLVVAMLVLGGLNPGREGGPRTLASVRSKQPQISAVSFFSREARADVVWVEGYDYIPAGYSQR